MYVYFRVILEFVDQFLCLVERFLERPGVGPSEKRCISLRIKVVKCVSECDAEAVLVVSPL